MTEHTPAYQVIPIKSVNSLGTIYYQVRCGNSLVDVPNNGKGSEQYAQRVAAILNAHAALVDACKAQRRAGEVRQAVQDGVAHAHSGPVYALAREDQQEHLTVEDYAAWLDGRAWVATLAALALAGENAS